jgi:hypothetical protein
MERLPPFRDNRSRLLAAVLRLNLGGSLVLLFSCSFAFNTRLQTFPCLGFGLLLCASKLGLGLILSLLRLVSFASGMLNRGARVSYFYCCQDFLSLSLALTVLLHAFIVTDCGLLLFSQLPSCFCLRGLFSSLLHFFWARSGLASPLSQLFAGFSSSVASLDSCCSLVLLHLLQPRCPLRRLCGTRGLGRVTFHTLPTTGSCRCSSLLFLCLHLFLLSPLFLGFLTPCFSTKASLNLRSCYPSIWGARLGGANFAYTES